MLHGINPVIDQFVSAVPFFLIVMIIIALFWAATKLFPSLGAWMNRSDEKKLDVEDYMKMYETPAHTINPRRWQ